MKLLNNKKIEIAILIFVIIAGFLFRIYGLKSNYSFWTDEASTARFGRAVAETGIARTNNYTIDAYYTTHYLTGFSFLLFGQNEFAARLPEVVFGTLLILIVYLFGKVIFNQQTGIAGALFTAFSYIQIAWSRQARGYTIFECGFMLYLLVFYLLVTDKINKKSRYYYLSILSALVLLLLVIFTHTLGLILIVISLIFLIAKNGFNKINLKLILGFITLFLLILLFLPISDAIYSHIRYQIIPDIITGQNFISYYHSLLWRNYPLFVFLTFIGLVISWKKKERILLGFFLIIFFCYLFEICFLLYVPFEKYILTLFPLIFIISSFSLYEITLSLFGKDKFKIIYFVLVIFMIINGNKFTLKPKKFYSLNFDMREIPEIDFKKIYGLVGEKSEAAGLPQVAIIDIEEDNPAWYLGENNNYFNPRNDVEGKIKTKSVGAIYIHNMNEFLKVINKYKYGFILLIEHDFRFYPEGMVDYTRKNFKLELSERFASFSPDWNYWPFELYSWGFEETKKK